MYIQIAQSTVLHHTVYFKGTARSPAGLEALADEEAIVVIRDADYEEIYRETFTTDEYGSFHGEIILGAEPPLGRYDIETTSFRRVS